MKKVFFTLLTLAFAGVSWAAQVSSTYYSAPAAGQFYLYNVTSGNFYTNGGWSSTPSALTTVTASGNYYRIQGKSASTYLKIGVYKGQYLWYDGTESSPVDWTFTTTSNNKFTVSMDQTNVAKDASVTSGTYYLDGSNATTTAADADEFALITEANYNSWYSSLSKVQNIPGSLDATLATVSSSDTNAGWNGTIFGYMANGSTVTFQLKNATAQQYTLAFDAAAKDAVPSVDVAVKDADGNSVVSKTITINQSGWNNYVTYRASIPTLAVGDYTLVLTTNLTGSGYSANMKNISVSAGNSADITLNEADGSYSGTGYYENVTLTRALSSTNWNTFCIPFSMVIPNGWTVKQLSSATNDGNGNITLTFDDATSIAAGQPYMVKCSSGYSGSCSQTNATLSTSPTAQSVSSVITFNGNYATQYVPQGSYFINSNNFYCADQASTVTMNGFRAYLTPQSTNAASINYMIDGQVVTSIDNIKKENTMDKSVIYNLNGCRVSAPTKGLYIVNGKKIVF
jgi:hypothetical protein